MRTSCLALGVGLAAGAHATPSQMGCTMGSTCGAMTFCARFAAAFSPATVLLPQSKLARSKLLMCDAAVAEPEAEDKPSVLDTLSESNAAILEQIKGLTLVEAAELIKQCEETFHGGDEDEAADEEAPATEE